jgi:hypothetical protein
MGEPQLVNILVSFFLAGCQDDKEALLSASGSIQDTGYGTNGSTCCDDHQGLNRAWKKV